MKIVNHVLIASILVGSFMQLTTLTVNAETEPPTPANKDAAETELPALTQKDIEELISRGDYHTAKIFRQQPDTVQKLKSTGVIVRIIEPDYVIIDTDGQRLEKIRGMGFITVAPSEKDNKRRQFRALIHSVEDAAVVKKIACDTWPYTFKYPFPFYIYGQAYDYEFEWAEEAGLKMEHCHSDSCD